MADTLKTMPIASLPDVAPDSADKIVVYRDADKDAHVTTVSELLGSILGLLPNHYDREDLFTVEKDSVTILANTQVNIDGQVYISTEDVTLSTSSVKGNGVDVYIYACAPVSGTEPEFVLSKNSTVPEGYTADNSRKIGGFHCLCADVGTISGHKLSGYKAGDILPASVWDLKHRPVSEPEGMVYDEGTGRWYDIYLPSWNGEKLVSEYGGVPVTGTSATPMHGLKFKEQLGTEGKRLLWRNEFMCVAKGSNQQTAISGKANPGNTGGHTDTAGRRMISDIGLEDCCGAFYQWANDEYENYGVSVDNHTNVTSSESLWTGAFQQNASNRYMMPYCWSTDKSNSYAMQQDEPICNYNSAIDSEQMGDSYGMPRQARVGGYWGSSSHCGSRCVYAGSFSSSVAEGASARGASEPRVA